MLMNSRSGIFDLIQSIANDLSLVNHLIEYYLSLIIDTDEDREDIKQIYNLIQEISSNRRIKMEVLFSYGKNSNSKLWCASKHAIESYMETYEFILSKKEITQIDKDMLINSYNNMASVLSLALNQELENCGRCFADRLLNEQKANA